MVNDSKTIDLDKVDMSNYKPIEPEPIEGFPGFYKIPNFSSYGISRDGEILNITRASVRKPNSFHNRYHFAHLVNDQGERESCPVHRLLMLVFDHPGISTDDLQVNHIDGDRYNNDLSNLEWVTCKQNLEHSNSTGLAHKRVRCTIRHVETGTIYTFPNMQAIANVVGLTKWEVVTRFEHCRLHGNIDKIWPEGWQYRRGYDTRPWREVNLDELDEIIENENGVVNRIAVRYYSTGEIKIFDKQTEAAKDLKIGVSTLSINADRENQPLIKTPKDFVQFSRKVNPPEFRELGDFYEEVMMGDENSKVVQSRNPTLNDVKTYLTAKECAVAEGVTTTNLNWWLKDTKVRSNGRQYRYYSKSTIW